MALIRVVGEGSDIDHLVIGKGGVYPVNTKRHPGGKVWVREGHPRQWAEDRLPPQWPVRGRAGS